MNLFHESLKIAVDKNTKKGCCLPLAVALPVCYTLLQMARTMDGTSLNNLLNAAVKILSGK